MTVLDDGVRWLGLSPPAVPSYSQRGGAVGGERGVGRPRFSLFASVGSGSGAESWGVVAVGSHGLVVCSASRAQQLAVSAT